jgi:hypothetical protein
MERPQTLPAAIPVPPVSAAPLEDLAHRAAGYASCTVTDSTNKAYEKDWSDFAGWCDHHSLAALPAAPATVGVYLTSLANRLAVATLTRRAYRDLDQTSAGRPPDRHQGLANSRPDVRHPP